MQTSSLESLTGGSRDGGEVSSAEQADVARRIAERSAARRIDNYSDEVKRMMDAGLAEMLRLGTDASPSVAAIVAAAGLSKDAFYRHFAGKDDFVATVVDAGTAQLCAHLSRRMQAAGSAAGEVSAWIEGVMGQAVQPELAEAVRVVVWNAHRVGDDTRRRGAGREQLARLLEAPIASLGSSDAGRDALLVGYAALMRMEEFLWRREAPTDDDIDQVVAFALRAIGGTP